MDRCSIRPNLVKELLLFPTCDELASAAALTLSLRCGSLLISVEGRMARGEYINMQTDCKYIPCRIQQ